MAIVKVMKSDISGAEIEPGSGARVRIEFYDGTTTAIRLDVTTEEAREIGAKGHPVQTRPERRAARAGAPGPRSGQRAKL